MHKYWIFVLPNFKFCYNKSLYYKLIENIAHYSYYKFIISKYLGIENKLLGVRSEFIFQQIKNQ